LGLQGLVTGDWTRLDTLTPHQLVRLHEQPAAALGSSRYRLQAHELPAITAHLDAQGIDALLITGGNGAMAAALALSEVATEQGSSLAVLGIPKTVDNDLMQTYASPGYASAANFIAETVRNLSLDLYAMRAFDDIVVLEVMGRHSGWLAAASLWARYADDSPPHLILVPELTFDEEAFIAAMAATYREHGVCLVVAAEGTRASDGTYLAEFDKAAVRDASGQRMLGLSSGVAAYVAHLVRAHLHVLCRQLRPDIIQRSARLAASDVDRRLAALVGSAAVHAAFGGKRAQMVTLALHKENQQDVWQTPLVDLAAVAGQERALPASFLTPNFDIDPAMLEYLMPLLGEQLPQPLLL
jgi:6-phosphofructokinase 1